MNKNVWEVGCYNGCTFFKNGVYAGEADSLALAREIVDKMNAVEDLKNESADADDHSDGNDDDGMNHGEV